MFKKLSAVACSCITVLLLLLSLIGGAVHTAAATLDEMTSTAISCPMKVLMAQSTATTAVPLASESCNGTLVGHWAYSRAFAIMLRTCPSPLWAAPFTMRSCLLQTGITEHSQFLREVPLQHC